jgi:DUF1365 family protein
MTVHAPLALYVGETTHCRFEPRRHSFRYRLFQILVDVDRLADAFTGLTLLRRGRMGLFSFDARDHGARDGAPLRPWVEAKLTEAGIQAAATRIRLLCFPRVLGFVFNPISLFFVDDAQGRLEAVIYEVNNTFGQTHAYVVPAAGHPIERQEADKVFYVSPFYRVEGGYRFRVTPPGEAFLLAIEKHKAGRADFTASLDLKRRPLSDIRLASLFLGMPLMTLGVVFAIHWQALRLWLKGAPFGARPPGPKAGFSVGRATRPIS